MITEYEEYIDSLQDELEQYKAIETLVKKLQGEKEFLEEEIEKVRKIKAMLENQINNYNETDAIKELKKQMEILVEENKRLKRLNKAAAEAGDATKLKNELTVMSQQLEYLEKQRNLLENDKDGLLDEIKRLRQKEEQYTALKSTYAENQADILEKKRIWEQEKIDLLSQVSNWKKMCDNLETEKNKLGKQLFEKNNEASFVRSHIVDLNFNQSNLQGNQTKG